MQKTILIQAGVETPVLGISGIHTDILNLTKGFVYASSKAGVVADADGVIAIPSMARALLLDSGGSAYILGTSEGKVQLQGSDNACVNFSSTPKGGDSPGGSGDDGATFTPVPNLISDNQLELSWVNDKGFTNPDSVIITAPQGEQGLQGERGLQGENARINGVNTLSIVTDNGIKSEQDGDTLTLQGVPLWETVSGQLLRADNAQGGVPFNGIDIVSKNLYEGTIKIFPNANGTLSSNENGRCAWAKCKPNTTYTIQRVGGSRLQAMTTSVPPAAGVAYSNIVIATAQSSSSMTYTTGGAAKYIVVYLSGSGENVNNVQIEQGIAVTAYVPSIIGQTLTLNVCGKNLLRYPYNQNTTTHNGITFTANSDGSITANGTATEQAIFFLANLSQQNKFYLPISEFRFSSTSNGDYNSYFFTVGKTNNNGNYETIVVSNYGTPTIFSTIDNNPIQVALSVKNGETVNNLVVYPQLEIGTVATEYKPYNGATYTITPDSDNYNVSADVRQVDGQMNVYTNSSGVTITADYNKTNPPLLMLQKQIDNITNAIVLGGE